MGIKYKVVGVCQEVVEHGVQPASPGTASIIPGDIVIPTTVGTGYMGDKDSSSIKIVSVCFFRINILRLTNIYQVLNHSRKGLLCLIVIVC